MLWIIADHSLGLEYESHDTCDANSGSAIFTLWYNSDTSSALVRRKRVGQSQAAGGQKIRSHFSSWPKSSFTDHTLSTETPAQKLHSFCSIYIFFDQRKEALNSVLVAGIEHILAMMTCSDDAVVMER